MEKLRKLSKALMVSIIIFFLLTLILAAIITFTSFKESWEYGGLIVVLSLSTLVFGYLSANAVGSKGIFVGLSSSTILMVLLFVLSIALFSSDKESVSLSIYMLAPMLFGSLGGIVGANSNK